VKGCPICLRSTDAQPCECGYDFETGDRARALRRASIVKARSTKQAWLGAVLLLTLPITVKLLIPFLVPVQLIFGLLSLWRGLTWRSAAQQRISRAERIALPAARVIE
jgi:hypothetical protein